MIQLESGILLIAEPFLNDPHFKRSVIILCEHQDEGSVGFIINKKMDRTLYDLVPDFTSLTIPVYYGGPVETNTLQFIHSSTYEIEGSIPVTKNISWGGNFEKAISIIVEDKKRAAHFKFLAGYAGWGHMQLDEEMKEKSWITTRITDDLVFNELSQNAWATSLTRLGGEYKKMVHYPIDPRLN